MLTIPSEHKIGSIYLMLGQKCNFNCKYCIQCDMKNNQEQKVLSLKTKQYLWHLIKIRPNDLPKIRLIFWGGEPFIYLDVIKSVIEEFGDKFSYWTVSNGSLLTKDIVDFLNNNQIGVSLSYDGCNTKTTRRIDITNNKEKLALFNNIQLRAIDSVISAYNYDYIALFEDCYKKFGNIPVTCEFLNVTWEMPNDLYNFDLDKYKTNIANAGMIAYQHILNGVMSNYTKLFFPVLNKICDIKDTDEFNFVPNCNQFYRVINIDLQGNIYGCHNCNDIVSYAGEDRIIGERKYQNWLRSRFNNKCSDCEYLRLCKGSCPLELNTENGKYMCDVYKIYYRACLDLARNLNSFSEPVDLEV